MKIKGKLPLPRETKSSIFKDKRIQAANHSPEKEPFKISKFKNIGSMLATQPTFEKAALHGSFQHTESAQQQEHNSVEPKCDSCDDENN